MDIDMPGATPDMPFTFDADEYFKKMREMQQKYADRIKINIGVELGLQPHLAAYYTEYTNKYHFDHIIGSVHIVHGKDPYYKEYFEGRSDHDAFLEYFECTYECIRAFKGFDVLGHLDYAIRYTPNKGYVLDYSEYSDILDAILKELISSGIGLEINTSGWRYGDHPHPHEDVIARYKELGGTYITVGSDAHTPESIAYAFLKAKEILSQ